MEVLKCKEVSEKLLEKIEEGTKAFVSKYNRAPGLAVILVGEDPASKTYVNNKRRAAERCGFSHHQYSLKENTSESEILNLIEKLNEDVNIDGILVQLPLPKTIDEEKIINKINPGKDVDGFTVLNTGRLTLGQKCLIPCTPKGILDILAYFKIETKGTSVTVIGRSNIVGRPITTLISQKGYDATVTICNSKTKNLKRFTINSDIVIVAIGKPEFITSDYIKDGTVIIDVGINRVLDEKSEKGYRLVGDVDFKSFTNRKVKITPVPGGVGLMTVSELMSNTLEAAFRRENELSY